DIMSSIRIYPNPVGDQAILEFNNKENGKARIEIINLTGQTIREFSINTIEGKQSFALDCNSWAAGSYFVKMTQGDACQIVKLLKNN
ncbi:MAG: T9SS type A sorting domain-containing protein, partial [Bacteroidetes bacterium]|nr:T9SS type A sorting domain-containing protein [Bacteroidota bacterium]